MKKVRISELARELEVKPDAILEMLPRVYLLCQSEELLPLAGVLAGQLREGGAKAEIVSTLPATAEGAAVVILVNRGTRAAAGAALEAAMRAKASAAIPVLVGEAKAEPVEVAGRPAMRLRSALDAPRVARRILAQIGVRPQEQPLVAIHCAPQDAKEAMRLTEKLAKDHQLRVLLEDTNYTAPAAVIVAVATPKSNPTAVNQLIGRAAEAGVPTIPVSLGGAVPLHGWLGNDTVRFFAVRRNDFDHDVAELAERIRALLSGERPEEAQLLPSGAARYRFAFQAVWEAPQRFELLESMEVTALKRVLDEMGSVRMEQKPNALWAAWMETVHKDKLERE
ncbi:MAG: hypothetical protein SFV54_10695 [Bryobacteraceae bacterium]|nr:hypothetical protein [Bryobacteraceae bacterium]